MLPRRFPLVCIAILWLLTPTRAVSQSFEVYDSYLQLEERLRQSGNTTIVVKFWATWCKPCVEELPFFETLQQRYAGQDVKVLLVSLDFKSQLDKRFKPFLKNQNLQSEVILLADQDMNTWIPKIFADWDGAIPATLVLRGSKYRFKSGGFSDFNELESFVAPLLTKTTPQGALKSTKK